jgi:hypothetical protein
MTDTGPPEGIDYQDHLARALFDLLPTPIPTGPPRVLDDALAQAGRIAIDRHNLLHRDLHGIVQRGGAVVWAMRQRNRTWREIYDATGIVQRTGDRWQTLFLKEGVDPRPADELDRRWQGESKEGA